MDDHGITLAAAIIGASNVAKTVAESGVKLIESLLGKACKVAGNLLADEIYGWQWSNRVRWASRVQKILDEKRIAARVVPKGFLLPVVEAVGNVEDEELQELWARLMASGVASDKAQHPALIDTLKRLNGADAKLLLRIACSPIETKGSSLKQVMGNDADASERLLAFGLAAHVGDAENGATHLKVTGFGCQLVCAVRA